jgi:hypothetical protein
MAATYQERLSESPFIRNFSQSYTEGGSVSLLPADGHWYLYVMKHEERIELGVGGPITKVKFLPIAGETEWVGVRFSLGTYMPHLPARTLIDNVVILPAASSKSFYLQGSAWEFPTHDNVDVFTDRLIRDGVLVRDPVVHAALQDQSPAMSLRSVQRRFLQTTGLTKEYIRQIERARRAMSLLQQGVSILDTVYEAGYFDQPHMTRSLKNLMGFTPGQIAHQMQPE